MLRALSRLMFALFVGLAWMGFPKQAVAQAGNTSVAPITASPPAGSFSSPSQPAQTQSAAAADTSKNSQAGPDSSAAKAAAAVPKSRSDSVVVVKHSFNHRQQIITGSVIMSCLALMMVTMNNYNPR